MEPVPGMVPQLQVGSNNATWVTQYNMNAPIFESKYSTKKFIVKNLANCGHIIGITRPGKSLHYVLSWTDSLIMGNSYAKLQNKGIRLKSKDSQSLPHVLELELLNNNKNLLRRSLENKGAKKNKETN